MHGFNGRLLPLGHAAWALIWGQYSRQLLRCLSKKIWASNCYSNLVFVRSCVLHRTWWKKWLADIPPSPSMAKKSRPCNLLFEYQCTWRLSKRARERERGRERESVCGGERERGQSLQSKESFNSGWLPPVESFVPTRTLLGQVVFDMLLVTSGCASLAYLTLSLFCCSGRLRWRHLWNPLHSTRWVRSLCTVH